jgi:hypothetical protein
VRARYRLGAGHVDQRREDDLRKDHSRPPADRLRPACTRQQRIDCSSQTMEWEHSRASTRKREASHTSESFDSGASDAAGATESSDSGRAVEACRHGTTIKHISGRSQTVETRPYERGCVPVPWTRPNVWSLDDHRVRHHQVHQIGRARLPNNDQKHPHNEFQASEQGCVGVARTVAASANLASIGESGTD